MIFVTVGAQMPFDRLVMAVDAWAAQRIGAEVLAQIGPGGRIPAHIGWTRFLAPERYEDLCRRADFIVAHAGTGSLLTALRFGKPILVMPRRAALRETRNDHQWATLEHLGASRGVTVATDETQLPAKLDGMVAGDGAPVIGPHASPRLIEAIQGFIRGRSA